MPKVPQIYLVPKMDWKKRLALFGGTFAALWLFIEPLGLFNVASDTFRDLGVVGYLTLIGVSFAAVLLVEYVKKRKYLGSLDFITITVLITTDGSRHTVQVPYDLNIETFIELFTNYLKKGASGSKIAEIIAYYYLFLQVQQGDEFHTVSSSATFRQVNISDGAICQLKGVVKTDTVVLSPRH